MKQFIIPGNTPSSKNAKQWTGKFLIANKNTQLWRKENEETFINHKNEFREITKDLEKPFAIHFSFVRKSRHKADFGNLCQAVLDEMTKHNWIDDDNMDEILPYPYLTEGKCHSYDKDHPCTIITIL
jgi:Holliday junction resolvase RusA-like endonuclease